MNTKTALIALSFLVASPVWAINKCIVDGKTIFQDTPCTGKGEKLDVRPASGSFRPTQTPSVDEEEKPLPEPSPKPEISSASPKPSHAPTNSAKTQLEAEADMCLAWYRPLLRDPKGAYYTNISKEKRVFSMDLHATNGMGGYVVKRAACEIYGGKLNDAWTKNHAKWGGWSAE